MEVMSYLTNFRAVWIGGRYGGGKSALAVRLALDLVVNDYATCIASNQPLYLGVEGRKVSAEQVQETHNCVVLLDEGWNQLGQGSDNKRIKSWMAYLRKRNQYIVLSSVLDLARSLMVFCIERAWNFTPFGVNLWVYRWKLTTGRLTKRAANAGLLLWWQPQQVFQYYAHSYESSEDYYIYDIPSESEISSTQRQNLANV